VDEFSNDVIAARIGGHSTLLLAAGDALEIEKTSIASAESLSQAPAISEQILCG
jgi:hypothetical protein